MIDMHTFIEKNDICSADFILKCNFIIKIIDSQNVMYLQARPHSWLIWHLILVASMIVN